MSSVLITGCSSGIGRETARAFLDAGWTVYATARDPSDVATLADRGAVTMALDVTRDADVARVVGDVHEDGPLDCLVNNAGYGQFGPVEDVPTESIHRQFDVNVYGPHRLARAVLPRMRERGVGRIIDVAAAVRHLSLAGIGVYTASKFALEAMNDALRQEVAGQGVDVVLVEPGVVATDFYDRAAAELAAIEHTPAYADLYRVLESIEVVATRPPGVNHPQRVASTIVEAATVSRPKPLYQVGPVATAGSGLGLLLTGRRRDAAVDVAVSALSRDWLLKVARRYAG